MQAQVKDDVQEAQPLDSASQKSVTDWLMHVISGKQPSAEERLRAATQETLQPDPIFQLDPPVTPKELNGNGNGNGAAPEAWTGAFTAEDLCGAPLIPMPVVVKEPTPAEDGITADDVCWVPEERRLKPQPVIPQPLIIDTPRQEQMASVVDITRDITRDPAPNFVRETSAPALVSQEREITAADISRQWVIDEMEQASATVAPEPELYVPQFVSTPAPEPVHEEIERPAEPIAAVAPEPVFVPEPVVPEPVAVPELTIVPEPAVTPEPMIAAEPEVAPEPVPEPMAIFSENVIEAGPEPASAMQSAAEPEIHAGIIETAQTEPVAVVEPETAVSEAAVEPAHGMAEQHVEAPEIADDSAVHVEDEEESGVAEPAGFVEPAIAEPTGVAEPDKYAGVKVWAKGGYWEGSHPAADGTEPPIVLQKTAENKIAEGKIEKGTAQQNTARGYFGSYLGPEDLEEIEKAKPEGWSQSWRTLIRLGSALPWLSRALPALEAGMGSHSGAAAAPEIDQGAAQGVNSEVQQDVAGMRLVQYEIRTTVQDHSAQLKRVEEQLARVRDSVEAKAANRELAEDVQSAMKMLKIVGIGLGGLLVILIVLALVMVMKH